MPNSSSSEPPIKRRTGRPFSWVWWHMTMAGCRCSSVWRSRPAACTQSEVGRRWHPGRLPRVGREDFRPHCEFRKRFPSWVTMVKLRSRFRTSAGEGLNPVLRKILNQSLLTPHQVGLFTLEQRKAQCAVGEYPKYQQSREGNREIEQSKFWHARKDHASVCY